MRISKLLVESAVSDVLGDAFEKFISDYNVIYSNDMFVAFTDSETFNIQSLDRDSGNGMYLLFPIEDVINTPSKYTVYSERSHMHVVQAINPLNVADIKMSKIEHLAKINKLSKDELTRIIENYIDQYKASVPTFNSYIFTKLLLNNVVLKEDITMTSSTSDDVIYKLRKLGHDVIFQNDTLGFLLSNEHKAIAFPSRQLRHLDTYELNQKGNNTEATVDINGELYYRDHSYMREVAGKVAEGLDTKLNSDPLYSLFLDYYFWTTDGIEITITVAFSDTEVSSTHDNVYYVVEADTPYGILVHRIGADKNLDNISKEIKDVYRSHVTPNESWEPKNRDVFLDQERKEYKLFDLHYDDISKVVDEYYPKIYNLARMYNIGLPALSYYGSFDKLFLHQFVEFLASNPTPATKLMKQLEDNEHDFNTMFFVPMPKKITMDILNSIALIYSEMKKRKPSAKGWYLFRDK